MRVLTIAAHPDDVELLCAGTLGLLGRRGHELAVAHMTVGDKGGQQAPEELARIRGEEARRAAALLGAQSFGGICGDLELYPCDSHAARIDDLIDETSPDVVVTHAHNDYHPDHRITGRLVIEGIGRLAVGKRPGLIYMDTIAGLDFIPEYFTMIGDLVELKKEMLRCHESQVQWMATYRHTDMEYLIEWLGRWRGLQCGTRYAEGFRLDRSVGQPEPLLAVLEELAPQAETVAS